MAARTFPLRIRHLSQPLNSKAARLVSDGMPHIKPSVATHRTLGFLCLLVVFLSAFGLAFVPLRASQDEWWHLKAGQWIWQHRTLPLNDIFTYTGENTRWYNHEWLSQLVFYGMHQLGEALGMGGVRGLIAFKAIVVGLTFAGVAWLARRRGAGWLLAAVIAIVAADVSRRTVFPRPPIFSYAFMVAFLLILSAWKQRRLNNRVLWLLPVLTMIWANFHGMVLLAAAVTGAFAAGEWIETGWRWMKARRGASWRLMLTRRCLTISAVGVAVMLAIMAQPSGWHIFFLSRKFTEDPFLKHVIAEMMPTPRPPMMFEPGTAGFWTPWLALLGVILLLILNRLRTRWVADAILLLFFAWQGFAHWRLLPLFAIASVGPAAALVARLATATPPWSGRVGNSIMAVSISMLVWWFNFKVTEPPPETYFYRNMEVVRGNVYNYNDYPKPLMDAIIEARLPNRMMSQTNYCGYAIWRLSPAHHKLFTDNRFDVFGGEHHWHEQVIFGVLEKGDRLFGRPVEQGWRELLDVWGVNFVVMRADPDAPLQRALPAAGGWKLITYYVPPGEQLPSPAGLYGWAVWLRDVPENNPAAARASEIFKRGNPKLPSPSQVQQWMRRPSATAVDWRV